MITIRKIIKRGKEQWEADVRIGDFRRRYLVPASILAKHSPGAYQRVIERWAESKASQAMQAPPKPATSPTEPGATPSPAATSKSPKTLSDCWDQWRTHAADTVTPGTFKSYSQMWRLYVLPQIGSEPAEQFTQYKLVQFETYLKQYRYLKKGEEKELSDSSLYVIGTALTTVLKWCKLQKYISVPELPKSNAKRPRAVRKKDTSKYLSPEQVGALLTIASEDPVHMVILTAGIDLGLRVGEIAGLQWADINQAKQEAKIVRKVLTVKLPDQAAVRYIQDPKGKEKDELNEVAISPRFIEAIAKLPRTNEWVLGGLSEDQIANRFGTMIRRAHKVYGELIPLSLQHKTHIMRHTCATTLGATGLPLYVKDQLRHADIQTSMSYIKDNTLDAVKKLFK